MTRETAAINLGRGENGAAERPYSNPYWDLDLLTPDDVCALLKVRKSWLSDAVENGALEAIRLGKQLRFRPSALIRYLDERVSNGNEDPCSIAGTRGNPRTDYEHQMLHECDGFGDHDFKGGKTNDQDQKRSRAMATDDLNRPGVSGGQGSCQPSFIQRSSN